MNILPRHIKDKKFPALNGTNHEVTSDLASHNCAAYVVDDTSGWCQPLPHPQLPTFWAEGVLRSPHFDAYMQYYSTYGYVECLDGSERPHFDRIAIYISGAEFKHVAKSIGNGYWASKMGMGYDIHHTLDALNGDFYGHPLKFMERHKMVVQRPIKVITKASGNP